MFGSLPTIIHQTMTSLMWFQDKIPPTKLPRPNPPEKKKFMSRGILSGYPLMSYASHYAPQDENSISFSLEENIEENDHGELGTEFRLVSKSKIKFISKIVYKLAYVN